MVQGMNYRQYDKSDKWCLLRAFQIPIQEIHSVAEMKNVRRLSWLDNTVFQHDVYKIGTM